MEVAERGPAHPADLDGLSADPPAEHVDEMAALADEPRPFEVLVPVPAVCASVPALTRYRATVLRSSEPNRDRISVSIGANRRLNPTISRSFPVASTVCNTRSSSSVGESQRLFDKDCLLASSARHTRSA